MGLKAIKKFFKSAKGSVARPGKKERQYTLSDASVRFAPTVQSTTVRSLSIGTDPKSMLKPSESQSKPGLPLIESTASAVNIARWPKAIVKTRVPSQAAHAVKVATRRGRIPENLACEGKNASGLAALNKLTSPESATANVPHDSPSKKPEQIKPKRTVSNAAHVKLAVIDAADLKLQNLIRSIEARDKAEKTMSPEEDIAVLKDSDTHPLKPTVDGPVQGELAALVATDNKKLFAELEKLEQKFAMCAAFSRPKFDSQDVQSEVKDDAMTTADLALRASEQALGTMHHFDVTVPVDWAPMRAKQSADSGAEIDAMADLALERAERLLRTVVGVDVTSAESDAQSVNEPYRIPEATLAQLMRKATPADLDEHREWVSQVAGELEFTSRAKAERVLMKLERGLIDQEFLFLEQSLNHDGNDKDPYDELLELKNAVRNTPESDPGANDLDDDLNAKDPYDQLLALEKAIHNMPDSGARSDEGLGPDVGNTKKASEEVLENMVDQLLAEGWDGQSVDLVPSAQSNTKPGKRSRSGVSRSSVLASQLRGEPVDRQAKRNSEMARVRKVKSGGRKVAELDIRTPLTQSLINMNKFKSNSNPTSNEARNRLKEIQARNRARRIDQDKASVKA